MKVNLISGVPSNCASTTCTAGAGTLVLEFGILSRLLDDPTIELQARKVVDALWFHKSNVTGLLGMWCFIILDLLYVFIFSLCQTD